MKTKDLSLTRTTKFLRRLGFGHDHQRGDEKRALDPKGPKEENKEEEGEEGAKKKQEKFSK